MQDAVRELHKLVDELPPEEAPAAKRYLEFLKERSEHPVARALRNAPVDDEPLTDEERRLIEEAREEAKRGEVISSEELRRSLGL